MGGSFACPECGCEVSPGGLSPGRRVRCGWCRTWVEVPFLPRADQVKTLRRRRGPSWRRRWPLWAKGAVTLLAVAIALAATRRVVLSHREKAESAAVARLVESSREAETSGRLGEALAAMEGALAEAGVLNPRPADLDELRSRRDRLARREAEAQLAALDAGPPAEDPGRRVGRALTLLARVGKDEALDGLEPSVRSTLERLRTLWAEADAGAAEAAFNAGRPAAALVLCQRLDATAGELPREPRRFWQIRATELARRVIARHGVIIESPRGQFTFGTPAAYSRLLDPLLKDALRGAGYLPRPAGSLWDDLWTAETPFRVTLHVKERQTETYLSSRNQVSALDATVTLSDRGRTLWFAAPVAQTRVPLPGLPAYQASRFSLSTHRSPEFERLLYENARDALVQQLGSAVHVLPACRPVAADRTATAATRPPA